MDQLNDSICITKNSPIHTPQKMLRITEIMSRPDVARRLRALLPKEALNPPDCAQHKYPSLLLKHLPSDAAYMALGVITERLLRMASDSIDARALAATASNVCGNEAIPDSVYQAKSTKEYLSRVQSTRAQMDRIMGPASAALYEPTVSIPNCIVEGHPDVLACGGQHVFEVKTTGQMAKNWPAFLTQAFGYVALCPEARQVHVVLPLQAHIWTWDLESQGWPKRKEFVDALMRIDVSGAMVAKRPRRVATSSPADIPDDEDPMFAPMMIANFPIGHHVQKQRSLRATLQGLPGLERPYQIFFTNMSASFNIPDAEIADAFDAVSTLDAKLYVHTPYVLNLSMEPGPPDAPNYVVESLKKHLSTAAAMGLRGVVVHVGKACKSPSVEVAVQNMRENLAQSLQVASTECPLILETPAGQGTETLVDMQDFMGFAKSIGRPDVFGVCIDTCHTFAAGVQPAEYLGAFIDDPDARSLVKLVHFNDSKTPLNSRVDRHALMGTGHIPKEQLVRCAQLAHIHGIPMIIE